MYDLPYYKANGNKDVIEFMHEHPFITLTGVDANNKPVATHVPVLFEEKNGKLFILGHIMKQTDHHKAFAKNENVLAIFTGPHTYVSASWYTNKQQGSTWNYQTVHASGKLKFLGDEELVSMLRKLTAKFENNPESPSLYDKLPSDYLQKLINAILAFEIEVIDIRHVFKLSQDRDIESHDNIVKQLKKGNANAQQVAEIMEKNKGNAINERD